MVKEDNTLKFANLNPNSNGAGNNTEEAENQMNMIKKSIDKPK